MTARDQKVIPEEETLEDWDSWDPMAEDYCSVKNTIKLDPVLQPECDVTGKMLNMNIAGKEVCEHFVRYGTCADGQYCDRLHVKPEARGMLCELAQNYDSNKARICLTDSYLSQQELRPNPNVLLLVTMASIKSPGDFVFIAPYDQMDFSSFTQKETDFYIQRVYQNSAYKTKLQKCHEQLATLFDHQYRIDDVMDDIHRSQIVACKMDDGRFCRARVLETEDFLNDRPDFKLFLIDMGIIVLRPRELIYNIKANCLSEPPMAINARLDLKPAKGQDLWSDDILTEFRGKLFNKRYLLCKVLNYIFEDGVYTVDLFDFKTRTSITDKMIECGFAEACAVGRKQSSWEDF